ncbi:transmembrane protein 205-like isoform X2 [Branchiostoma floridae]|uniref:Transmembrane protein 205-like isoform X2 n=1 Tax=Branchiostoma floridae TaxID=7739 RepID=A0A9J7HHZ6_BRAFL|nr:transmembrane protein 205-like isoform X2 [Branchiostoma floridae]
MAFENLRKYWPTYSFAQPFNAMMLLAAIVASFLFFPGQGTGDGGSSGTLLKFLHLFSVCTHFGTQAWVTFVAGLTMFHNLPRHTFGHIQGHLFPKYFTMGSVLGLVAMVTYMYEHRHGDMTTHQKIEIGVLVSVFVSALLNAALIGPTSLELMTQQYMIEKEHGHGDEIGTHPSGKIRQDPKYQKVRRQFLQYHAISSLVNMVALVGNGIHVYYLACQLAGI